MRPLHCTLAAVLVAWSGASAAGQQPPPAAPPGSARFVIFVQGSALGSDSVTVTRTATGTIIDGSARVAPPVDVVTRNYEVRYDGAMRPVEMTLQGTVRGQVVSLHTTFSNGTAQTEVLQGDQKTAKSDAVTPDALVLLNQAIGSYEALALRLRGLQAGAELRAYIPPQGENRIRLTAVTSERIQTPAAVINARRYQMSFGNTGSDLAVELWTDPVDRMIRLTVPAQSFEAVREDVASVGARREVLPRAGDEQVMIPSEGFSLAATISRPVATAARLVPLPAVVLVGAPTGADRDETVAGVPIFAELAGAIADAGFLVIRYDRRGVGQSGGRAESATIADYAEDVRAVVRHLATRGDIDRRRIAVAGYSEGGWAALLAAAGDKSIAALILLATPGSTGAELNLEQQQHTLDRMTLPDADKQAKIALQKKIQQAAITGKGWDGVPPEVRRQADTPWFQSFLLFDPARVIGKARQPVLIVEGDLDKVVPPAHADHLTSLARQRKPAVAVDAVKVPGINHLFVPAATGEIEEYGALRDKAVSRQVMSAVVAWLQKTMTTPGHD
jgi:pimeloyl-ACP methyl ester carboxylesterase